MNPAHEEVHEDEARIYKNDPQHRFVPSEQIKDNQEHDPFEKASEEVIEENEIDPDHRDPEIEEDEWERRRIEQLSNDIKFSSSEGVASVGPDVEGDIAHEIIETTNRDIEPMIVSRGLDSMSHAKIAGWESRRHRKLNKDKGAGHDNFKKQKRFGDFFKNLFGITSSREENMQSIQDSIDLDEEKPMLNGKLIDKNFLEKEDDIAA